LRSFQTQVLVEDPEVIVSHASNAQNAAGVEMGYTAAADDSSKLEEARQGLMQTPGIAGTEAVVDGRVYFIVDDLMYGPQQPVGVMYMAKWFYPERFGDLDPEEEDRKYWEEFMDLEDKGVFVYPEE
jgi:iron complex transport system substrate-binding protein